VIVGNIVLEKMDNEFMDIKKYVTPLLDLEIYVLCQGYRNSSKL